MKRGFFLTIEGPDGSGKSTQALLLAGFLRKRGLSVVHTREPGGTSFAEELRQILLNPRFRISHVAELMLYEASRAQHVDDVIRPGLKAGKLVFCERYTDATTAYQGYGRKLDLKVIEQLNGIATGGLAPDLTLVLDISPKEGLNRARVSGKTTHGAQGDRLERAGLAFHQRVRKGYFALARRHPRRIRIVSAAGGIEEVHRRLCAEVARRLPLKGAR